MVERAACDCGLARGGQAVEEALGARAGVAVAGLVGMHAGLVACDEFEVAQVDRRVVGAQRIECRQRRAAARALRGEEKQLVDVPFAECLQRREERADGLADAGRCLRHHRLAARDAPIHRLGEQALAAVEVRMREAQGLQCRIAPPAVCGLGESPGFEALGVFVAEREQLFGARLFLEPCFPPGVDVEVDQPQRERRQRAVEAELRAVELELRPVQLAVMVRDRLDRATMGLDLLDHERVGLEAVGAAANPQAATGAFEAQLLHVARAAAKPHGRMALDALLRARRGREAQVEVAAPRGEGAEFAHGDGTQTLPSFHRYSQPGSASGPRCRSAFASAIQCVKPRRRGVFGAARSFTRSVAVATITPHSGGISSTRAMPSAST